MIRLKSILFPFILFANQVVAQNQIDSIYIAQIDSILIEKKKEDFEVYRVHFEDTSNHRWVAMDYHEGKLVTIHYTFISCEHTSFHVQNDSLICVEYQLSDPDIRSSLPPSSSHVIYFKQDKQVRSSLVISGWGDPTTCDSHSVENKDFLEEFNSYKWLDLSKFE